MKILKTVVSLLMCMILAVSVMPISASEAGTGTPTIAVETSDEVKPGENVTVTLSLKNNPGITTMRLYCDYDGEVFTLTEVNDEKILGSSVHKDKLLPRYTLFWFNPLATTNYTTEDVFVTLTFKVSDKALAGDHKLEISYDASKKDILNADMEFVAFDVDNTTITVADVGQGKLPEDTVEPEPTPGNTLDDVKFRDKTYTYDGKKKTITVTGLPEGAKVTYTNNSATNAGIYNAKAKVTLGDESVTLYAKLTIEPKAINITGLTAKDKVYDGNTAAVLSGGKLSGVVSGDDVSAVMPTAGRFENAEIGSNKKVTFTAPVLRGSDADNYELKLPTLRASITEEDGSVPETTPPTDTETTDPTVTPTEWVNPFTDVSVNDWFFGAVKYASENGIMNGVATDKFDPTGSITRAMFVTVLHRIEGTPEAKEASFSDVADGSWYEAAVNWASEKGIVNGTSATTFAPDAVITREQMATIIYRYAKVKEYELKVSQTQIFADSDKIADYAKEAMNWTADKGLITGVGGNMVAPTESASRAEAATILQRLVEKFAK